MVPVIVLAVIVLVALLAIAFVVGVIDAAHAQTWRQVAAERREKWEERVRELHGGIEAPEVDRSDWDDD